MNRKPLVQPEVRKAHAKVQNDGGKTFCQKY